MKERQTCLTNNSKVFLAEKQTKQTLTSGQIHSTKLLAARDKSRKYSFLFNEKKWKDWIE